MRVERYIELRDAARLVLEANEAIAPHVQLVETAEAKLAAATLLGALMKLEDAAFPGGRVRRIGAALEGGALEVEAE